ncbi:MAG: hypothetical protein M3393_10305 [Actinomycetota bacterium]|nr:hypothetical protein [Actinomycetota bacterium]
MGQIVRALEETGPQTPEHLAEIVGSRYWEANRFERALSLAASDGLVVRTAEGTLSVT